MGGTPSERRNLLPPKVPRSVHGMSGDRSLHTKVPVSARAVGRDFDSTSGCWAKLSGKLHQLELRAAEQPIGRGQGLQHLEVIVALANQEFHRLAGGLDGRMEIAR